MSFNDHTSIDFELIRWNNTNILTDNDRTIDYLDKIFEFEPDVVKNFSGGFKHELPHYEKEFDAQKYTYKPNIGIKSKRDIFNW